MSKENITVMYAVCLKDKHLITNASNPLTGSLTQKAIYGERSEAVCVISALPEVLRNMVEIQDVVVFRKEDADFLELSYNEK